MTRNDNGKTDEQIVKQVLLGGIESFKTIVERYQKKIFGIGMRFFNNREDSLDFTQEVFLRTFESLKSYAGRAPFRFWLTKIAYNHGINRAGSRKTEPEIAGEIPGYDETPESRHLMEEMRYTLLDAVNRLPERYRVCVDMYFFLGLTYGEISEITGFPVNTIKSNVLRAKTILRDELRGTIAEEYHEL
ncbi:MAG: sigma-70 family RNA polymerase sigma factor [Spirochaetes bacterium]|nr:sigma-70 family RNA polymerase sigma factor [Spirochaetota bacterium]